MVPHPDIPDNVRRLIAEQIPSVERLEILVLLYDGRKHPWTVHELQQQIRSTPESIRQNLNALIDGALAVADSAETAATRYKPGSESLDAAVTELALVYRMRRVSVIELIYSERGPRNFSDAFKLGKPHDR